jgi:hypothetical protein
MGEDVKKVATKLEKNAPRKLRATKSRAVKKRADGCFS